MGCIASVYRALLQNAFLCWCSRDGLHIPVAAIVANMLKSQRSSVHEVPTDSNRRETGETRPARWCNVCKLSVQLSEGSSLHHHKVADKSHAAVGLVRPNLRSPFPESRHRRTGNHNLLPHFSTHNLSGMLHGWLRVKSFSSSYCGPPHSSYCSSAVAIWCLALN